MSQPTVPNTAPTIPTMNPQTALTSTTVTLAVPQLSVHLPPTVPNPPMQPAPPYSLNTHQSFTPTLSNEGVLPPPNMQYNQAMILHISNNQHHLCKLQQQQVKQSSYNQLICNKNLRSLSHKRVTHIPTGKYPHFPNYTQTQTHSTKVLSCLIPIQQVLHSSTQQ